MEDRNAVIPRRPLHCCGCLRAEGEVDIYLPKFGVYPSSCKNGRPKVPHYRYFPFIQFDCMGGQIDGHCAIPNNSGVPIQCIFPFAILNHAYPHQPLRN